MSLAGKTLNSGDRVRHQRFGTGTIRLDEGETPLQAAKRELIEETGYRARSWKKIAAFWPSPGYVSEQMTIFLARDLTEGEATPMHDEKIEIRWFDKKELDGLIGSGKIQDGKTLIGFMHWRCYRPKR
jgi:ADP-ribose pyrophosphatase